MKRTIFFFAKVFEKKEYAEALLDGKLYINRLSYFRKIEEEGGSNRSDRYEGVINWLQPDKMSLKINDFEIDSKDLVEPVSIQMNYHGNLNVFCIYAAHSGRFENVTDESLPDFRKQLEISDDCLGRALDHFYEANCGKSQGINDLIRPAPPKKKFNRRFDT